MLNVDKVARVLHSVLGVLAALCYSLFRGLETSCQWTSGAIKPLYTASCFVSFIISTGSFLTFPPSLPPMFQSIRALCFFWSGSKTSTAPHPPWPPPIHYLRGANVRPHNVMSSHAIAGGSAAAALKSPPDDRRRRNQTRPEETDPCPHSELRTRPHAGGVLVTHRSISTEPLDVHSGETSFICLRVSLASVSRWFSLLLRKDAARWGHLAHCKVSESPFRYFRTQQGPCCTWTLEIVLYSSLDFTVIHPLLTWAPLVKFLYTIYILHRVP